MSENDPIDNNFAAIISAMREEYWSGIVDVEEDRGEFLDCVTFVLGGETYAFETVRAAEVLRVPKLVKVPGVPAAIVGIFNLRGEITTAIDIRPLLGLPITPLSEAGRIIVLKGEKFMTGLLTEEVCGVTPLSQAEYLSAEKSSPGVRNEFVRGEYQSDGKVILLLDVDLLLASSTIMAAGESTV